MAHTANNRSGVCTPAAAVSLVVNNGNLASKAGV